MSLLVPIVSVALLAGAALVCIGLRGRKVSEHPHCRKCGFDLEGLNSAAPAKCPECGARLALPRAVRMGWREKRWSWVVAGGAPLIAVLASLLLFVASGSWRSRINAATSTRLLLWEVGHNGPMPINGVIAELTKRHTSGGLKPAEIREIAGLLVSFETIKRHEWKEEWGDFIESAWSRGLLDEATVRAYLEHGTLYRVDCRKRVLVGQTVPLFGRIDFLSGWRAGRLGCTVTFEMEPDGTDSMISYKPAPDRRNLRNPPAGEFGTVTALALGKHRVSVRVLATYLLAGQPPVSITRTVERTVEVVRPEDQVVHFQPNPQLSRYIKEHLRPWPLAMREGPSTIDGEPPNRWQVTGQLVWVGGTKMPKENIAVKISLVINGVEYDAGVGLYTHGDGAVDRFPILANIPRTGGTPPSRASISVKSCRDAALTFLDADTYWEGAFVIPDVSIQFIPTPSP